MERSLGRHTGEGNERSGAATQLRQAAIAKWQDKATTMKFLYVNYEKKVVETATLDEMLQRCPHVLNGGVESAMSELEKAREEYVKHARELLKRMGNQAAK